MQHWILQLGGCGGLTVLCTTVQCTPLWLLYQSTTVWWTGYINRIQNTNAGTDRPPIWWVQPTNVWWVQLDIARWSRVIYNPAKGRNAPNHPLLFIALSSKYRMNFVEFKSQLQCSCVCNNNLNLTKCQRAFCVRNKTATTVTAIKAACNWFKSIYFDIYTNLL